MINSWCAELCKTMIAVRTCWWQESLAERNGRERRSKATFDTLEDSNGNEMTASQMSEAKGPPKETYDYLPPPFTKTALDMMLTSHLSTGGSTIVVGPDAMAINQVSKH